MFDCVGVERHEEDESLLVALDPLQRADIETLGVFMCTCVGGLCVFTLLGMRVKLSKMLAVMSRSVVYFFYIVISFSVMLVKQQNLALQCKIKLTESFT